MLTSVIHLYFQDNEPPTELRNSRNQNDEKTEKEETEDSASDEEAEELLKNLQILALPASRYDPRFKQQT